MPTETKRNCMPMWQLNAHVDDGLLIRGGIPHSGGKLAFHAFERGFAGMVSRRLSGTRRRDASVFLKLPT